MSVNQEIAHEDTAIQETATRWRCCHLSQVGSPYGSRPSDDAQFVRVQREDFSVDAEINRVRRSVEAHRRHCDISWYARDRSKGRDVDSITFEHYEGMAQKKLREIRERALKDFDIMESRSSIGMAKSGSAKISC